MQHDFFTVRTVTEVTALLTAFPPLPPENLALDHPLGLEGRVLAAPVTALDDVPLASRSGMDGYAVRAADTFGAAESNPAYLNCVGHIDIQKPAEFRLEAGQCASIVTGGIVPQGSDAIVMVEYTHAMETHRTQDTGLPALSDLSASAPPSPQQPTIEIRRAVPPGEYVMLQGEDARSGQVALPQGTMLRPQEIGLLAAVGACSVSVHQKPVVAILSTGDEVIPAESTPRVGQVRDVNSHTLAAMVRQSGATALPMGIAQDQVDELEKALRQGLEQAHVVLLSGGSSVGVRDLTVAALQRLKGTEIFCHGVALSPGKPLILARTPEGKVVWGLPGQVTSAQVVMKVLGQPFLRHLSGYGQPFEQQLWPQCRAKLSRNVASQQGREDYVRVRLEHGAQGQPPLAVPLHGLSGLLRTLTQAQGLVRIAAPKEGLEQGQEVDVILFEY